MAVIEWAPKNVLCVVDRYRKNQQIAVQRDRLQSVPGISCLVESSEKVFS